jgi:oligoribonuclease
LSTLNAACVIIIIPKVSRTYSALGLCVRLIHLPTCGNTVSQDRRFMFNYMSKLEQFFHYRTIDVSTLKELARRWKPELLKGFEKRSKHEALADIYESIDELKYYREHFIKI